MTYSPNIPETEQYKTDKESRKEYLKTLNRGWQTSASCYKEKLSFNSSLRSEITKY